MKASHKKNKKPRKEEKRGLLVKFLVLNIILVLIRFFLFKGIVLDFMLVLFGYLVLFEPVFGKILPFGVYVFDMSFFIWILFVSNLLLYFLTMKETRKKAIVLLLAYILIMFFLFGLFVVSNSFP